MLFPSHSAVGYRLLSSIVSPLLAKELRSLEVLAMHFLLVSGSALSLLLRSGRSIESFRRTAPEEDWSSVVFPAVVSSN